MMATIGQAQTEEAIRKRRCLIELVVGYGMILLVIWTPRPWQRLFYLAAAIFIATVTWLSFHSWRAMGLRLTNLLRSIWIVGVALLVSAVFVSISNHFHALRPASGFVAFVERYWGYAIWAFVQQLLLQDFFLRRFLILMSGRQGIAALASAGIFSLAHLPNPILTPVTFLWGLSACFIFLHYRNIFPLSIAHAIFGITLAVSIPSPVIRNMRVGLGYLTYPSTHRPHHRSHADHIVSTHA